MELFRENLQDVYQNLERYPTARCLRREVTRNCCFAVITLLCVIVNCLFLLNWLHDLGVSFLLILGFCTTIGIGIPMTLGFFILAASSALVKERHAARARMYAENSSEALLIREAVSRSARPMCVSEFHSMRSAYQAESYSRRNNPTSREPAHGAE